MYEGLRLTELHEEWAWLSHLRQTKAATALDAEIRARVAAQPVGRPEDPGFPYTRDGKKTLVFELFPDPAAICAFGPLVFGVPDAERVYPAKRRTSAEGGLPEPREGWIAMTTAFPFDHWANHAAHFLPAEGCHLCREGQVARMPPLSNPAALPPLCRCFQCGFRTYDDMRDCDCPRCKERGRCSAMESDEDEA